MSLETPVYLPNPNGSVATSGEPEVVVLPIKALKLSGGTQPRTVIDETVVAEYAEEMLGGAQFPPIDVFHDGTHYWPSDGFHRIRASVKAGRDSISARVFSGSRRDAALASFAANTTHGLRRSIADKRRAVTRILEDQQWTFLSDSEIARHCCVSPKFVSAMRVRLGIESPEVRTVVRGGKRLAVRTGRKSVLESPDLDHPSVADQKTQATLFDRFLDKIRARGLEARTHVPTEFGPIDIETKEAIYIIAGAMNGRVFRDAFVTLLFQKQSLKEKRAVIVGTIDESLRPWVVQAKQFGVEFVSFGG